LCAIGVEAEFDGSQHVRDCTEYAVHFNFSESSKSVRTLSRGAAWKRL
jgi:hypothetical protein